MKPRLGPLGVFAFLGAVIVMAALAHIVWSGLVTAYLYSQGGDMRLPQVSKLQSIEDRLGLISATIEEGDETPGSRSIVLTGGSLTYGYDLRRATTFPHRLAGQMNDWRFINLSLMGLSVDGEKDWIYCPLAASGRKFDVAVIEIPVVNQNGNLLAKADIHGKPFDATKHRCLDPGTYYAGGFYDYLVRRPYGINWVRILRDDFIYAVDGAKVALAPLPDSYMPRAKTYPQISKFAMGERADLVAAFEKVADKVIVFQSPMYVDGLDELGFGLANAVRQNRDGIAFCKPSDKVVCLDTSRFNTRAELFRDVVHFNTRGSAEFADWLHAEITRVLN